MGYTAVLLEKTIVVLIRQIVKLVNDKVLTVNRIVILAVSINALAATSLISVTASGTKWECGERSNLSVEGKNYCATGDYRQSETELNKVFAALLEKYKVAFDDVMALNNAQNAFESYRNNQCNAENRRIEDKPYHAMVVAQCKTRLTNIRIDELERMQQQYK